MNTSCDMTWEENCLVVRLSGEVDHHQASSLRNCLDEKIAQAAEGGNAVNLIFSFSGVSFMDSSGIGVIMGRYNKIKETGGKVFVTECDTYVDRILEMSGIYTITHRRETAAQALQECREENGKAGQKHEQ